MGLGIASEGFDNDATERAQIFSMSCCVLLCLVVSCLSYRGRRWKNNSPLDYGKMIIRPVTGRTWKLRKINKQYSTSAKTPSSVGVHTKI